MILAFLSSSSQLGGAERSLLDLVASIRRAQPGWTVHVLLPDRGPLEQEAARLGALTTVVALPDAIARLGDHGVGTAADGAWDRQPTGMTRFIRAVVPGVRYVKGLRSELRRIAPDIVHTNGLKMHVFACHAVSRRTPIVWHVRDFIGGRRLIATALRVHRHRCAAAIANSDAVAADVRTVLDGTPVHRVYNGIDLERFAPEGPAMDLDRASGLAPSGDGVVRVGLLATFARWKGHDVFMKALSLLSPAAPVRGYIIGGPLYATEGSQYTLPELHDIASKLGLTGRIGFPGHVDDPPAAIRALDIVVHASTAPEPFGRVIIEAMACERAVLASDAGGASEILSDLPEARYAPGDAEQLARRITELASSSELRLGMARAGRTIARRRYDRRRLAEEVIPIYEGVLDRSVRREAGGHPLTHERTHARSTSS